MCKLLLLMLYRGNMRIFRSIPTLKILVSCYHLPMNEEQNTLTDMVEALSRERDELQLKLKLAKLELLEQWEPLEDKWVSLEARLRAIGDTSGEAGKEVLAATKLLLDEIGDAYKQIWKQLKR